MINQTRSDWTFTTAYTLPLASDQADLASAGGKGANLARLARAGFPVPGGFLVTTRAYREFVTSNDLETRILALLPPGSLEPEGGVGISGPRRPVETLDPDALEQSSSQIRELFRIGVFPDALRRDLQAAYADLAGKSTTANTAVVENGGGTPEKPVAVRSSATAEDLPDMSFAGQQDTFLNVVGEEALLQAVVECWSSLWTARAIGYRQRNGVPHTSVALAVVVQAMVESQASGVLFTANPLTGLRSETVIDATLGLGEALVSGQVDPDHYVVASGTGQILSKTLGSKTIAIHSQPGGGVHSTLVDQGEIQALPDAQILALVRLGSQVAELYGFPQDIEWAWADESLYLLQSRPVTALFPLPAGLSLEPLKVFFSFGAVQGMLESITPLGRDSLSEIFAFGAGLFNVNVTRSNQAILYEAGERLWVNVTAILSNSIGRRVATVALNMVEPSVRQAMDEIWDDPRLQPGRSGVSFKALIKIAHFILPLAFNVLQNLVSPTRRRKIIIENGEKLLREMEARRLAIHGDRWEKLAQAADLLPGLALDYLPHTFLLFVSGVAAGMASWNALNMLAGKTKPKPPANQGIMQPLADRSSQSMPSADMPGAPASGDRSGVATGDLILQVTRGMPYNPTTEMDLALWEMARSIRQDAPSWQFFQQGDSVELAVRYRQGDLPLVARQHLDQFLAKYGGRGLGEIDLGRPRWAEDPTHVIEMLSSFLLIGNEALAPDVVFARAAQSAEAAIDQLVARIRQQPHGRIKARLARFFAGRARQLMGLREHPKFFAVRLMYIVRRGLLETGQEMVEADVRLPEPGNLNRPDDLFYLTLTELQELAARQEKDWRGLIAIRREAYQRELRRRQVPRLLISDGRAFYKGLVMSKTDQSDISGSPVSPGSVEGLVRVVLDPRQAGLLPGEILVCPGTDPSWTPLFFSAAGLVMEVGGMMTHGAVVAREYGIPAIVGVDQATTRLFTGQRIRIDGSSGIIEVIGE